MTHILKKLQLHKLFIKNKSLKGELCDLRNENLSNTNFSKVLPINLDGVIINENQSHLFNCRQLEKMIIFCN